MNQIEKLIAQDEIRATLYKYCKSIDCNDWDGVRSCFWEEHRHQHGIYFSGSLDEFIGFAKYASESFKRSRHCILNLVVEFSDDGLSATSDANFTAVHFIEGGTETEFFDTSKGDLDWLIAGDYQDKWKYRDGQWRIIERHADHLWERLEPSNDPRKET